MLWETERLTALLCGTLKTFVTKRTAQHPIHLCKGGEREVLRERICGEEGEFMLV